MFGFGKKQNNDSATQHHSKSTQSFLEIAEVRDGIVVLKDGGIRSILAVSSVNFSLKSEDEQNAIVGSYQGFLNSLDFPIQILMQSRRMDINPYLDLMKEKMRGVTNQLMQMQISEYIDFIGNLVQTAHIMNKTFFVVIPYNFSSLKTGGLSKFTHAFHPAHSTVLDTKSFDEHKSKLKERTNFIASQLGSMGLQSIALDTEEIIELLYSSYNIGAATALHSEALGKLELGD